MSNRDFPKIIKTLVRDTLEPRVHLTGGERAAALCPTDPPSPASYEGLRPSNSPIGDITGPKGPVPTHYGPKGPIWDPYGPLGLRKTQKMGSQTLPDECFYYFEEILI